MLDASSTASYDEGPFVGSVSRNWISEAEPSDPFESLWSELFEGRWSIAKTFDERGRRNVVLRRNRRPIPLSPTERVAIAAARDGSALKVIASDLGLSISTIAYHLGRGLKKMGVCDRSELVALAALTERPATRRP